MRAGLAIIPARGGSKRFPRKNLARLGGQSLTDRALEAAVRSGLFSTIILSSDDDEILDEAARWGDAVTPVRRDAALARDRSTALELVQHLVSERASGHDIVALLLPTAPLRSSLDLQRGSALLDEDPDAEGVVSLTTYEFPPQLSVKVDAGLVTPVGSPSPLITGNTRGQDQGQLLRPNGAFYIKRVEAFMKSPNFWTGRVLGYVMDRVRSPDIDTPLDLAVAELYLGWEEGDSNG